MSVEAQQASADLVAIGIMSEHFGATRFASAAKFELDYEEMRDLIALAYLHGKRDATAEAQRVLAS